MAGKKSHHYINYIFINVGLFIYGLQPQLNFEITTFARWLQLGLSCCKYFSSKGQPLGLQIKFQGYNLQLLPYTFVCNHQLIATCLFDKIFKIQWHQNLDYMKCILHNAMMLWQLAIGCTSYKFQVFLLLFFIVQQLASLLHCL